jgi:hypothetical protein
MFFEFVKTNTGWRVFWGIDPHDPQSQQEDRTAPDSELGACLDPDVLPFRRIKESSLVLPAA